MRAAGTGGIGIAYVVTMPDGTIVDQGVGGDPEVAERQRQRLEASMKKKDGAS